MYAFIPKGTSYSDIYNQILSGDLDVNQPIDQYQNSLLHYILSGKEILNIELLNLVIEKGDLIDKCGNRGSTPLHIACAEGIEKAVEILIEKGSDIEKKNIDGLTALDFACARGRLSITEFLISKGANIETIDNKNDTPLIRAVSMGYGTKKVVEFLLKMGANVNHRDILGVTALHMAAIYKDIEEALDMIKLLLDYGADPNEKSVGYSPFDIACRRGQIEKIKLLLEHGVDLEIESNKVKYDMSKVPKEYRKRVNKCFRDYDKKLKNIKGAR